MIQANLNRARANRALKRQPKETILWRAHLRVAPSEGRCSVCGETVADSRSYCASCLVPHHDRCWEYNGKCGIYGCSCETRVKARALAADPFSIVCLGKAFAWAWFVLAVAWLGSFVM